MFSQTNKSLFKRGQWPNKGLFGIETGTEPKRTGCGTKEHWNQTII